MTAVIARRARLMPTAQPARAVATATVLTPRVTLTTAVLAPIPAGVFVLAKRLNAVLACASAPSVVVLVSVVPMRVVLLASRARLDRAFSRRRVVRRTLIVSRRRRIAPLASAWHVLRTRIVTTATHVLRRHAQVLFVPLRPCRQRVLRLERSPAISLSHR